MTSWLLGQRTTFKGSCQDLPASLLLNSVGNLDKDGVEINFIGRTSVRQGDSAQIRNSDSYTENILKQHGLLTCKAAATTGPQSSSKLVDQDEPLDSEEHSVYRSTVGKLMWMIGLRYDLFYAVKELSRSLTGPTQIDSARLRHVLR